MRAATCKLQTTALAHRFSVSRHESAEASQSGLRYVNLWIRISYVHSTHTFFHFARVQGIAVSILLSVRTGSPGSAFFNWSCFSVCHFLLQSRLSRVLLVSLFAIGTTRLGCLTTLELDLFDCLDPYLPGPIVSSACGVIETWSCSFCFAAAAAEQQECERAGESPVMMKNGVMKLDIAAAAAQAERGAQPCSRQLALPAMQVAALGQPTTSCCECGAQSVDRQTNHVHIMRTRLSSRCQQCCFGARRQYQTKEPLNHQVAIASAACCLRMPHMA